MNDEFFVPAPRHRGDPPMTDEVVKVPTVDTIRVVSAEKYDEAIAQCDRLQETLKRVMKENSDYIDGIESENDLMLEGFRLVNSLASRIVKHSDNPNFVRTKANNILSWIRINIREPVLDDLVEEAQDRGEYD